MKSLRKKSVVVLCLIAFLGMAGLEAPGVEAEENQDPNLIAAYFEPGQEIRNAVGVRYKFRVNSNQSSGLKILFNGLAFYNPDTEKGWNYFLENNIYSNWIKYSDNQYNCKWPPRGNNFSSQAGFWVSISDYWKSGLVGVRQVDENTRNMFPRQNSGIDDISGLTKIETISQMSMNEKDVSVEILRGDIFQITESIDGWGYRYLSDSNNPNNYICESKLPPGDYRIWKVISTIDNKTYGWEFLMPESYAKYIHSDIKNFFTEFFKNSGFFQAYFWDIEFLKENTSIWEPMTKWKVGTSYGGIDSKTNGFKLAVYDNHPVIEVSNSGQDIYYKYGDIFRLPPATTQSSLMDNLRDKQKIVENLLLANKDLTIDSDLIKNPDTFSSFHRVVRSLDAAFFSSYNQKPVNISFQGREILLDSMSNTIRQIPYLQKWGLYEYDRNSSNYLIDGRNFKNAIKELIGLYMAMIFDLNPVTNPDFDQNGRVDFNDELERKRIKDKIKTVLNLDGWYSKTWNKFSILIGPGMSNTDDIRVFDKEKQLHYNFLSVYPNVPKLIGHGRLFYGGLYPISLRENMPHLNLYDDALGDSLIEPGLHGTGHEIDEYLHYNDKRKNYVGSVTWSRLVVLAKAIDSSRSGGCFQYLAAYEYNWDNWQQKCESDPENFWPPSWEYDSATNERQWCKNEYQGRCPISPPELLASTVEEYMKDSEGLFTLALQLFDRGYKNPLNQFLFIFDIFSVEKDISRFYYLPNGDIKFTVTDVPLVRNSQNHLTSFTSNDKTYNLELDEAGNVLSYTIEVIPDKISYGLTVAVSGTGSGLVTASAISCPVDCSETYKEGEQVTLTAIPDNNSNSIFKNWQGDCQGTINLCTLTMDSNKSATAVFEKNNRPPVINPIGNKSVKVGRILSFNVSASDPDGDSLSYSASNLPSGATFVNGGFRWRPDYTQSRAEDYQATFKAEDGKGGFDEETIAITVKDVEQPKHPPRVESLVLRDTDSHSRAYTNALKVRFVLRASDNGWVMYYFLTDDSSIIDGKTISADKPVRQWLPAGKTGFGSQNSQSHKWIKVKYPSYGDVEIFSTFNLFPGTDGKREVRAFVKDRAGNVSAYKAASITLDTAKPVVTITTSPIANETTVNRFSLSGTASDALSGFKERAIEWKHRNASGKASVSNDGSWLARISELKAGDNVVTVTVVDKAGNKSEPATFTVKYNPSRRFVSKKAKYKW